MDGDGNADLYFGIGRGDGIEYDYIKRCIKIYGFCIYTERSPAIKKENKGCQLVLTLRKPSEVKKLLSILIVFSFACSKQWGKTCWDCEVTRLDRTTYYEKVCNDGTYPKFKDRQGNKLTSYCSQ